MHWHQTRQKLLAENVANADTPGFKPEGPQGAELRAGAPAAPPSPSSGRRRPSCRWRLRDGRATPALEPLRDHARRQRRHLEDEMMKVAQNQLDYQLAASLYRRACGCCKIAVGKGARPWTSSRRSSSRRPASRPSPGACASSPRTSPTPTRPRRSPAPTLTGARSRPSRRNSTASSTPRSSRSAASSATRRAFRTKHEPGNPAADAQGDVKLPNVNSARRADGHARGPAQLRGQPQRHHATRRMIARTLDILRA